MLEKVSNESENLIEKSIADLQRLFPHCFIEGKIDFEKLKKTLGYFLDSRDERYFFNWAGRNNAFKTIQATSNGCLVPLDDQSINFEKTENLFIEGDNLEVLKLLQKSYFEQVKIIYIDPPYNTGNDFIYRDDFTNGLQAYLEQTGQVEDGIKLTTNPETNGRFHSDWLSMMFPRLYHARNLLREDGLIFVSIDDNEVHNLRLIMNEIFGEENHVVTIIWKKRSGAPNDQIIGAVHEYILCYCKNADTKGIHRRERSEKQLARYKNPDNHPKGDWTPGDLMANVKGGRYVKSLYFPIINPNTGVEHYPSSKGNWRFNKETIERLIANKEIYFGEDDKGRPKLKRFLSDVEKGVPFPSLWEFPTTDEFSSVWDNMPLTKKGSSEIAELFGSVNIFETTKPVGLIKEIISLATTSDSNDLVLDFFAGSGTTAHAVLEKNKEDGGNRKFLCIQLPEPIDKGLEAYKAGYKTISDICKERIRKVLTQMSRENKGKIISNNIDLGFKAFKLAKSNFRNWKQYEGKNADELRKEIEIFKSSLVSKYKEIDLIYEILVKEGFSLNSIVEKQKIGKNMIYKVTDKENTVLICLDEDIKDSTIESLGLTSQTGLICLDSSLNDSKKANLSEQCNLITI